MLRGTASSPWGFPQRPGACWDLLQCVSAGAPSAAQASGAVLYAVLWVCCRSRMSARVLRVLRAACLVTKHSQQRLDAHKCLQARKLKTATWRQGRRRACSRRGICRWLEQRLLPATTASFKAPSRSGCACSLAGFLLCCLLTMPPCSVPRRCFWAAPQPLSRPSPSSLPRGPSQVRPATLPDCAFGTSSQPTWPRPTLHGCPLCGTAGDNLQYHGPSRGASTIDWASGTSSGVQGESSKVKSMKNVGGGQKEYRWGPACICAELA